MRKTAIALCFEENLYRKRFERCWMSHYKHLYHMYLFSEVSELLQADEKEYEIIITDICRISELEQLKQKGKKIIVLWETENDRAELEETECLILIAKYQEVYKIEEKVSSLIQRSEPLQKCERANSKSCKIIGIFSLDCESMQMPFAALAACEYGEKQDTLLINLQAYSGFETDKEEVADFLGMEDLMSMSSADTYAKGRLYGAIGHEKNWDYIYPSRNAELLSEANDDVYQKIIEKMIMEFGYRIIVINFGTVFLGISTMFEQCDEFYLLVSKKENMSWRETEFRKEMERKEKGVFLQQIKRMEIPVNYRRDHQDWKGLMQQWRWSEIGDKLRKHIWTGV